MPPVEGCAFVSGTPNPPLDCVSHLVMRKAGNTGFPPLGGVRSAIGEHDTYERCLTIKRIMGPTRVSEEKTNTFGHTCSQQLILPLLTEIPPVYKVGVVIMWLEKLFEEGGCVWIENVRLFVLLGRLVFAPLPWQETVRHGVGNNSWTARCHSPPVKGVLTGLLPLLESCRQRSIAIGIHLGCRVLAGLFVVTVCVRAMDDVLSSRGDRST